MGRGMIITAIAAVIIFGLTQVSMLGQKKIITESTADYAKIVHAKNTASTAIQLAMERLNQDTTWSPSQGNPWETSVYDASTSLYIEELGGGTGVMDPDTIRIYSTSTYLGQNAEIVSTYIKRPLSFVPEFNSALAFATDNFTLNIKGSANINGNDASGTCSDKPAVTVQNQDGADIVAKSNTKKMTSSVGPYAIDPDLSYSPIDELIARLYKLPTTTRIKGNYKGDFGSADNPGVFFVEEKAKLTGGISEGFGILVVRTGGELQYEGELMVAGNFKFNGLVIFENAFNFTGRGTPDIKGSVLVGNTEGNNSVLDVDLSGNIDLQYDCSAEEYAKEASYNSIRQNRYTRLSTFE